MNCFRYFVASIAVTMIASAVVFTQEAEERVVDEVVVAVNDNVITLSRIKREIKALVDLEVQQGKPREQAEREIEAKKGELIANLINEELLVQKAKELGLDNDIDAMINQRFVDIMKENNLKSLEALYEQMRQQNVDPQEIREMWRKQLIRDRVIQREVQYKLYWSATPKELKDYFEKNKAKFTKPETISISEIFLSFAGRSENSVREKAANLVKQLREGADFEKLAKENSDPGVVTEGRGKAEKIKITELAEILKGPLKDVAVGGVTDPIEVKDLGIVILRVDAREKASGESFYDENAVRSAILQEKFPKASKEFFAKLREDAVIRFNESYRPLVAPILYADERKDKALVKEN